MKTTNNNKTSVFLSESDVIARLEVTLTATQAYQYEVQKEISNLRVVSCQGLPEHLSWLAEAHPKLILAMDISENGYGQELRK